jgi:hypothetical protein
MYVWMDGCNRKHRTNEGNAAASKVQSRNADPRPITTTTRMSNKYRYTYLLFPGDEARARLIAVVCVRHARSLRRLLISRPPVYAATTRCQQPLKARIHPQIIYEPKQTKTNQNNLKPTVYGDTDTRYGRICQIRSLSLYSLLSTLYSLLSTLSLLSLSLSLLSTLYSLLSLSVYLIFVPPNSRDGAHEEPVRTGR